MQTVKFNRRAVLLLSAVFFCLLIFYVVTYKEPVEKRVLVGRDVELRRALQKQRTEETEDIRKEAAPEERKEEGKGVDDDYNTESRGQKVKEMMLHAWRGYRNYSWGANETPHNQQIFGGAGLAATIVDAADTLYIMGLEKEYKEARDFIEANFDMRKATGILSVFETTIRFLGGLLSLYALTHENFYLEKAQSVGDALLPAFNTPSGVPKSNLNVVSKSASNYNWAQGASILAEFGSLHLEFVYLSRATGQPIFEKKVRKVRDVMDRIEKVNGLFPNYFDPAKAQWTPSHHMSLGALGDSFYEYLLKSWLQSNRTDAQAQRLYWDTSEAIKRKMVFTSKGGLTYVAELRGGNVEHKMGHLACFCVGMFAMEAHYETDAQKKKETMELAEQLGRTCHESYIRSASHIGPEMFYFNDGAEAMTKMNDNGYILRPEVIEGFFYLWRITGKQQYREWVWDAVQAIDRHCRVEAGFAGLSNVYKPEQGHDDVQQSFFLAETLKYAYLTFSPSSLIPLSEWVFNTEAHPLPVLSSGQMRAEDAAFN